MAPGIYWRPDKGGFSTSDGELHFLLSQLGGALWYQWSELLFRPAARECCMLCGLELSGLDHEAFERHGRAHRAQLGPELTAAVMSVLYMQCDLTGVLVHDLLGYDMSIVNQKYAFWARSRTT